MTDPDAELMEIYGTTKEANEVALAARIAAAVLGLGLMAADKKHVEEQKAEAELLNEIARHQEAEKMESMIDAMKMAEASGATMARAGMDKVAIGAFIGKALGSAAKASQTGPTLGTVAMGAAKKVAPTAAVLGTGYLGYKGLSAARDYANTPKGNQTWGTKRPLRHNVSEWGYPTG